MSREGRSVKLAPITPGMVGFLYDLATDDEIGWRWRYAGVIPRRDTFEQFLWNGVLSQFVVVERATEGAIGSVIAYNADLNNGFAYVAAGMSRGAIDSGIGVEAVDLFIAHLFACYRLRKLYFEVPEYNLSQFSSAIGWLFRNEGVQADHTFYNGRFWDRYILALYRGDYEKVGTNVKVLGRRRRPVVRDVNEHPVS